MMARIAWVRELCRIVSELVSYSFFHAVSEKPANNFLATLRKGEDSLCYSFQIRKNGIPRSRAAYW